MIRIFLAIILFLSISVYPQVEKKDSINYTKLYVMSGVTAATFIYAYGLQNDMWWKGRKSDFHFNWQQDWNASLGADKVGHLFFGYTVADIYNHAFQYVGYSKRESVLYSGILAFTYQTFLEIRDGFSSDYGFSWGDFSANLIGSTYPILQNEYPTLRNFNFKISYQSSERFKNNSNKYIMDDYESTYHWLTIDFDQFLPENIEKLFPDFVNIALGHSVNGLNNLGTAKHEFFIGLDWDIEGLPGNSPLLSFIKNTLNLYHLPAPTIKIYPNIVWYGLKF